MVEPVQIYVFSADPRGETFGKGRLAGPGDAEHHDLPIAGVVPLIWQSTVADVEYALAVLTARGLASRGRRLDAYVPALPDAASAIGVTEVARATGGESRTIAVPNWLPDQHSVTVQHKDYPDRDFPDGRGCFRTFGKLPKRTSSQFRPDVPYPHTPLRVP
ncbi:hypothetical protein [Amycolatopsis sp. DG1A-15b]|uniref:hypothetical protein n=1 Tax=Amycolatopsis sp. DG1A-15b TaxID=3052846 RepID=UPI00255B442D|nr:hypothetical protein [Amycolatopsis sp. DG1A-15b]WIX91319.1 hypothetical protein QRY02_13055 [Amycolatopsis sp. DG1A-15b]